jgi:hypothetical protein
MSLIPDRPKHRPSKPRRDGHLGRLDIRPFVSDYPVLSHAHSRDCRMFKIGDKLVPLAAENDGCRSYYRVVSTDGEFVDVVNTNLMGRATPRRRLASEFVTKADWDSGVRDKVAAMDAEARAKANGAPLSLR